VLNDFNGSTPVLKGERHTSKKQLRRQASSVDVGKEAFAIAVKGMNAAASGATEPRWRKGKTAVQKMDGCGWREGATVLRMEQLRGSR
jgi:hypothetical protein